MSDQSFREIQLSGKGLILLFMGSVVVLVAVFLLGVSVGGGVQQSRDAADVTQTTMMGDADTGIDAPGPTELMPGDQRYHDELQGTATAPAQSQPPEEVNEPIDLPAESASAAAEEMKPAPPAVTTKPVPAPAPPPVAASTAKPAPATAAARQAPVTGGWFLQVNAFRSRANADRQVRELTAKKYPAFVVPAGELFRVRVGPYAQRSEAESMAARLRREGMKPSVTR